MSVEAAEQHTIPLNLGKWENNEVWRRGDGFIFDLTVISERGHLNCTIVKIKASPGGEWR